MKAKCPNCGGKGCDKCKDGFVDVKMAEGIVYDLVCKKCGAIVGFHIDQGNDPPEKDMSYMSCVTCPNPQNLEWVLSAYSEGNDL